MYGSAYIGESFRQKDRKMDLFLNESIVMARRRIFVKALIKTGRTITQKMVLVLFLSCIVLFAVFLGHKGDFMTNQEFIIVTNNPLVEKRLGNIYKVIYIKNSYEELLKEVRDRVHKGHILLSHPLSGSVKPKETPYKSVMLSTKREKLDMHSLSIIESGLEACSKFVCKEHDYTKDVYDDFQLVDISLLESAIASV